jgi:hypothetical protein
VELRQLLKIEGPSDFTVGQYSSNRARTIAKRSNFHEKEIYDFLVKIFGKQFVHREYLFNENKRVRTDFFVYHRSGQFAVDAFYPKDRFNLIGCINSKLATYDENLILDYPVIFLMLNKDISKDVIQEVIENKRKKLEGYQHVMNLEDFESFCRKQKALTICTH